MQNLALHVRFQGRSEDLTFADLRLAPNANDTELMQALAKRYDCQPNQFAGHVIVREKQAVIVRPEAFYG
jgi:hypothetical protein